MTTNEQTKPFVLVVDDEEIIHRLSERIFGALGFDTIWASDGTTAQSLFEAFGERCSLLILDIVLPDANGPELAKDFLSKYPQTPILFTSGYGLDEDLLPLIKPGQIEFLAKPFTKNDLELRTLALLRF